MILNGIELTILCPTFGCNAHLMRWAWWEWEDEPIMYFYCLDCDKAGRNCIHVMWKRDMGIPRVIRAEGV